MASKLAAYKVKSIQRLLAQLLLVGAYLDQGGTRQALGEEVTEKKPVVIRRTVNL